MDKERILEANRSKFLRYYYRNHEKVCERQRLRKRALYAADPEAAKEKDRKWRAANPERVKAYNAKRRVANRERQRKRRAENPELTLQKDRAWRAANRDKMIQYNRKHRGLPIPARSCPAVCECCGSPPGKYGLHLDHCHVTGAFRGWLCAKCNTAIGKLGDSLAGVQRAVAYLSSAQIRAQMN